MSAYGPSAAAAAPSIQDRIEAAHALRKCGRLQDALEVLSGHTDYSRDVYSLRGDLQLDLGQPSEAVGSYSAVLLLEPENLHVRHHLALCLRSLKRWAAAAEAFQTLLLHQPHSDQARIGLGDCLLHMNQPEEALAAFDACWSEAARLPALFGKAVSLQMLGRLEQAEALYERLLELNAAAEEVLSNMVAMSMEAFDLARVQRHAQRLLERHPRSAIALRGLTAVAVERREYNVAAGYFASLQEIGEEPGLPAETDDPEATQYRLSRKHIERFAQIRGNLFPNRGKLESKNTELKNTEPKNTREKIWPA